MQLSALRFTLNRRGLVAPYAIWQSAICIDILVEICRIYIFHWIRSTERDAQTWMCTVRPIFRNMSMFVCSIVYIDDLMQCTKPSLATVRYRFSVTPELQKYNKKKKKSTTINKSQVLSNHRRRKPLASVLRYLHLRKHASQRHFVQLMLNNLGLFTHVTFSLTGQGLVQP